MEWSISALFCMVSIASLSHVGPSSTDENTPLPKINNIVTVLNNSSGNSSSNENSTSINANTKTKVDTHRCSWREQQYCHRYIKNIFVLYTGYGGWVMLGIIVLGVLLEIHFLLSGRNVSYVQYRRNDFKYFLNNKETNPRNRTSVRLIVIDKL